MQSDENIRLAYRHIKRNTGSKTAGYDGLTIEDIKKLSVLEVVSTIQQMFEHYRPQAVRRVFIPKTNGKTRPLGIPTIWDRLFQQCILQVLEPICEARFYIAMVLDQIAVHIMRKLGLKLLSIELAYIIV